MATTIASERRLLTDAEFETVARSHYPALNALGREEAVALAQQIREQHDRLRTITREREREKRAGSAPRAPDAGTGAAPAEPAVTARKQVFAAALKRLNRRLDRLPR